MTDKILNSIRQALNTMYFRLGRFRLQHKCEACGGKLQYDEHYDAVCTECGVIQEYGNIVTTEFMNASDHQEYYKQPTQWERENAVRQGKRSKNAPQKKLLERNTLRERIGRVCSDLKCDIHQLKKSTVLQHKFAARWDELYKERISRQNLRQKMMFFERLTESKRC